MVSGRLDLEDCIGEKMRNAKKYVVLVLLLSILVSATACSSKKDTVSGSQFIFGTIVSIEIFGENNEKYLKESFEILKGIENRMSLNLSTSEVEIINQNAGKAKVKVSEDVFEVIEKALYYAEISEGSFDISLAPVIELWQIGTEQARVPSEDELRKALSKVDYHKIQLDKDTMTVYLEEEGMSIDLGGIAKGYAADQVKAYLQNEGIESAIINLGGNIMTLGEKVTKEAFKVGLQNPFKERNEYLGILEVRDLTVVTSGIYERNFTQDGVTYHHIMDTKSGYPIDHEVAAVTIVTKSSVDADALSTTLFALGVEKGLALAEELEDIECLFVTKDYQLFMSSGIQDRFILTDEAFEVQGKK